MDGQVTLCLYIYTRGPHSVSLGPCPRDPGTAPAGVLHLLVDFRFGCVVLLCLSRTLPFFAESSHSRPQSTLALHIVCMCISAVSSVSIAS